MCALQYDWWSHIADEKSVGDKKFKSNYQMFSAGMWTAAEQETNFESSLNLGIMNLRWLDLMVLWQHYLVVMDTQVVKVQIDRIQTFSISNYLIQANLHHTKHYSTSNLNA